MWHHKADCTPFALPDIPAAFSNGIQRRKPVHALKGSHQYIQFVPTNFKLLPQDFFINATDILNETINLIRENCSYCKMHPVIYINMIQIDQHSGEVTRRDTARFSLPALVLTEDCLSTIIEKLMEHVAIYVNKGSNWRVEGVFAFDLNIIRYQSCPEVKGYANNNGLPPKLTAKKAVVNVYNTNKYCFKYALLSILHYQNEKFIKNHRARSSPSAYNEWVDEHNWDGITFPMTTSQLTLFEKNNPNILINLLAWNEKLGRPRVIRHSPILKEGKDAKIVIILYIETCNQLSHFVGVTNIDRLLGSRISTSGKYRYSYKHCERCFIPYLPNKLKQHRTLCYTGKPETVIGPEKSDWQFTNWAATQRMPYVVYADIECTIDHETKEHKPAAFGYLLVPNPYMKATPLPLKYYEFVGLTCVEDALQSLDKTAREIYEWNKKYSYQKPIMTQKDKITLAIATTCLICNCILEKEGLKMKVLEHDHLSGKFRGATCQACNTKMRVKRTTLPIMFHNLKGYDSHILCAAGLGKIKGWSLSCIPITKEKYVSIIASFCVDTYTATGKKQKVTELVIENKQFVHDDDEEEEKLENNEIKKAGIKRKASLKRNIYFTIQFKDSAQFLLASLAKLIQSIPTDKLVYCKNLIPSGASISLITNKGIFPYEYFDSLERMKEHQLPPIDLFYDSLNLSKCSQDDYTKAQEAWISFGCNNFGEYMLAYLKLDVYQLADVFEAFRALILKEDGLDPVHYYTLPGLTWDSAFKFGKVKVDLLKEVQDYIFIERGIRGGMTFVNTHYIEANTPLIPDTYDLTQPRQELLYIDANNLYGNALSFSLPQDQFKMLVGDDVPQNIAQLNLDGDIGYIFEVDLHYPTKLHDSTEDLPFAPERLKLGSDYLTPLMKTQWGDKLKYRGHEKLMITQWDKEKYVIHGKLLQFYVQQGLIVTKIHSALQFHQSNFFASYINYNSEKRQKATTDFDKNHYKMKNNALFGKSMENQRKKIKYQLCNTAEHLTILAARPDFRETIRYNDNLVGVLLSKDLIKLNKPIFIGQAVLDLSKLIMYKLRYEQFPRYETELGGSIKIVGGDTDSFFLSLINMSSNDLLTAMKRDNLLDSSNYPNNHPLFSNTNKAKLGCIKDEAGGTTFKEWVFLRPKCYSLLTIKNKEMKRAKGVRRATVAKIINHALYKEAFLKQREFVHNQTRLGSTRHQLRTINYDKKSLSFFENKRAWVEVNKSHPYGNHRLQLPNKPSIQTTVPPIIIQY